MAIDSYFSPKNFKKKLNFTKYFSWYVNIIWEYVIKINPQNYYNQELQKLEKYVPLSKRWIQYLKEVKKIKKNTTVDEVETKIIIDYFHMKTTVSNNMS